MAGRLRAHAERLVGAYLIFTASSVVVLVVLCVVLLLRVSATAANLRAASVVSCQRENADRATDQRVFGAILRLPAIADPQFITPANAAAQRTEMARIRQSVSAATAQRDCGALYSARR